MKSRSWPVLTVLLAASVLAGGCGASGEGGGSFDDHDSGVDAAADDVIKAVDLELFESRLVLGGNSGPLGAWGG